jgi:hypothetical protein
MNSHQFICMCDGTVEPWRRLALLELASYSIGAAGRHKAIDQSLRRNPFLSRNTATAARSLFYKAQRVRRVLATCARRKRYERLRQVSFTNTDLSLEPLSSYPAHHKIAIECAGGGAHEFFIGDLLRHWVARLLSQEWRDPRPKEPTNPYTNEAITPAQFMRVCCLADSAGFRIHDALLMLYRHEGNLTLFRAWCSLSLREWAAYTYAHDGDADELYDEACEIKALGPECLSNIVLAEDPPHHVKVKIVARLRPVLVAHSLWSHSINAEATPLLRRRFFESLRTTNEGLAGTGFGRELRCCVDGRWALTWNV